MAEFAEVVAQEIVILQNNNKKKDLLLFLESIFKGNHRRIWCCQENWNCLNSCINTGQKFGQIYNMYKRFKYDSLFTPFVRKIGKIKYLRKKTWTNYISAQICFVLLKKIILGYFFNEKCGKYFFGISLISENDNKKSSNIRFHSWQILMEIFQLKNCTSAFIFNQDRCKVGKVLDYMGIYMQDIG